MSLDKFFNSSNKEKLKVGLMLNISTDDEPEKNYKSRIADIQEEGIAIELPIEEGTGWFKPFLPNTSLRCFFFETDGVAYAFPTRVLKIVRGNIPMLLISMPEDKHFEKIQRRDYLRVAANLEFSLTIKHEGKEDQVVEGTTVDLSGGGLAYTVVTPSGRQKDEIVQGRLSIPMEKLGPINVSFEGRIIRVLKLSDRPFDNIAIRFEKIDERDREKIIRYCISRQAELRKKLRNQ